MQRRYGLATLGFALGLGLGLLLSAILQGRSGNTYQVYHGGIPGEIYTSTWSPTESAVVVLVFSAIGLVLCYRSGANSDRPYAMTRVPGPSWWLDLGVVALIAVLSTSAVAQLNPFRSVLDPAQVALVAAAVGFGSGMGLLAGAAGPAIGAALSPFLWWSIVVSAGAGGLEGIVTARLAAPAKPARLLAAVAVAAVLALLPVVPLYLIVGGRLISSWMLSILIRMSVSAALGLLIGLLVRTARQRQLALKS